MIGLSRRLRKKQAGRFICLLVMFVFGSFTIATTGLLVRSIKMTEMEDCRYKAGDYDAALYMVDIGIEEALSESEIIDDVGLYYELGTVTDVDGVAEFKAVSLKDDLSEDIYHMTCIRGSYPQSEDEIAIDISVAHTYGVPPYPGESIDLKMYNSEGEYIGSKSYRISGVFRASSGDVAGGWYRCPYDIEKTYSMPAVFFYAGDIDAWNCTKESIFLRAYSAGSLQIEDEIRRIQANTGKYGIYTEYNYKRGSGFSNYLGIDEIELGKEYGDVTWDSLGKAVSKGMFERDFYSSTMLPIIALMVIVTEIISINMLSKNIVADRKEHYAVLRSIGMSSKRIIIDLVVEFFGFCIIGSLFGASIAILLHKGIIHELNSSMNLRLYNGIDIDKAIKCVTYDPLITAVLVCVLSLALSLIVPLRKLYNLYPSELLSSSDEMFVGERIRGKRNKTQLKGGWLGLLNRRIDLHDNGTMIVMAMVLSAMLFGYLFFQAFSDYNLAHEQGVVNSFGLDGQGYIVDRNIPGDEWRYNVTNRHDAGITPDMLEIIINNPNVSNVRAVIFNDSTRMVFDNEPNSDLKTLLNNRLINIPEGNSYAEVNMTAEKIIFEHMGYDPDVYMYELPTVGLTSDEMLDLNAEVVSGRIDLDKIRTGEEVVLAVPEELADICQNCLPVGSAISFDDIALTEEEERLDLLNIEDEKWMVYDANVDTPIGEVYVRYDSVGTRCEIETTVGAIVVLHDEREISDYLSPGSSWVQGLQLDAGMMAGHSYGMSVLCLGDSFANWGLPDRNYTSVKVSLSDKTDVYQFDKFWYQTISDSVGIKTDSTFDYMDEMNAVTQRTMVVFYFMSAALILLGLVSILSGLYTKTRGKSERLQSLRRIGLSVEQTSIMIYTQNIFYPIISTLIAVIPVYLVQSYFNSIYSKIMNGEISSSIGTGHTPWYFTMPITKNMFSYNFVPALIVCFLIGVLLIVIGTLPQIMYLRKMKMIAEKEE